MESLRSLSADAWSIADFVGRRDHPEGLDPVVCFGANACVYEDGASATGYTTCGPGGVPCRTLRACADDHAFSVAAGECVEVGAPCDRVVEHNVYKYTNRGECSPSSTCEPEWTWTGTRCGFADQDEECEPEARPADADPDRVWRFDIDGACTERVECRAGVFSHERGVCVEPNTVCADAQDRRLMRFDALGQCVPANECEPQWELYHGTCLWARRGGLCDPTPEERAMDDKRVFEFEAHGACIATNRCADGWSLNASDVCNFDRSGQFVEQRNGRNYVYDELANVVAGSCIDGFALVGDQCHFEKSGTECPHANNEVHRWAVDGKCAPTGQCIGPEFVYRDGACVPKPQGCPAGFAVSGDQCYRSFHMGGEGSKSIAFDADPAHQISARYDFRKEPRYRDGDYTISSNFGLGGSQHGIRGSHSRSSGWTSGKSHYTFHARQNDGHGVLHVWLKYPKVSHVGSSNYWQSLVRFRAYDGWVQYLIPVEHLSFPTQQPTPTFSGGAGRVGADNKPYYMPYSRRHDETAMLNHIFGSNNGSFAQAGPGDSMSDDTQNTRAHVLKLIESLGGTWTIPKPGV